MRGTGSGRLPGLNGGRTGLAEAQAAGEGYDVMTALAVTDDKAHYYPGAATFITKLVADRQSRRLLGAQVFGPGSVDKMIDIAATGIAAGMTLDDFDSLDLAYAPPFSTAIHPLVQAVYVLLNKLSGAMAVSYTHLTERATKGSEPLNVDPVCILFSPLRRSDRCFSQNRHPENQFPPCDRAAHRCGARLRLDDGFYRRLPEQHFLGGFPELALPDPFRLCHRRELDLLFSCAADRRCE